MGTTDVVVGRVGRPHGVHGEVSVEPRTDEPQRRFADGSVLESRSPAGERPGGAGGRSLTVTRTRSHQGRLLVTFEGVGDRTAAEAMRGLLLVARVDTADSPADPEEFYDHQLVGLTVRTTTGESVGEVEEVLHSGAQDLLVIRTERGSAPGEVLVPFVTALVPLVDLAAGVVEVADRPGLLFPLDDEAGR